MDALSQWRVKCAPHAELSAQVLAEMRQDPHVIQFGLEGAVTDASVNMIFEQIVRGMEYAYKEWGEDALPEELLFCSYVVRNNRGFPFKICVRTTVRDANERLDVKIVFTYGCLARHAHYWYRGIPYFNDHISAGMAISSSDGIAITVVEECFHVFSLHDPATKKMLLSGGIPLAPAPRNHELEVPLKIIIPRAIEALGIAVFPRVSST